MLHSQTHHIASIRTQKENCLTNKKEKNELRGAADVGRSAISDGTKRVNWRMWCWMKEDRTGRGRKKDMYVSWLDPMRVIILDLEFSLLIMFEEEKKHRTWGKIFPWKNFLFLASLLIRSETVCFRLKANGTKLHCPFMPCITIALHSHFWTNGSCFWWQAMAFVSPSLSAFSHSQTFFSFYPPNIEVFFASVVADGAAAAAVATSWSGRLNCLLYSCTTYS